MSEIKRAEQAGWQVKPNHQGNRQRTFGQQQKKRQNVWEQTFKRIISSEARGMGPSVARVVLHGLSFAYGAAMSIRNAAFDFGWKKPVIVEVPVIAIGNLTTGGTGKTPIVAAVVQMLHEAGQQPGIVSRGYRSDSTGENDEKRVLALKCPNVPHQQDPDRVTASMKLIGEGSVSAIVLDDAFQHRRIHRNLNLVLIDATNPFGFNHLLPRGLLRESISGLRRADFVLVTRADSVSEDRLQQIRDKCVQQDHRLENRIARVSFQPTMLLDGSGESCSFEALQKKSAVVMTGIGNPDAFVSTCKRLGLTIVDTVFFPDHHHFTSDEVAKVSKRASELDAVILTTVKDLVKINAPKQHLYAVDIEAVFESSTERLAFEEAVKSQLSGHPSVQ